MKSLRLVCLLGLFLMGGVLLSSLLPAWFCGKIVSYRYPGAVGETMKVLGVIGAWLTAPFVAGVLLSYASWRRIKEEIRFAIGCWRGFAFVTAVMGALFLLCLASEHISA